MPICNVLIKTLGSASGQMEKFILQLDSPLLWTLKSFQIVPSNQFGFDFVGQAFTDPFTGNTIDCWGNDPNTNSVILDIELDLPDDSNPGAAGRSLVVGMQGTGSINNNPITFFDILLWKVVSISGQPPSSWPSMDIFQDLPAPSSDSAVV
ncbi:MAG: hypothetical protein JO333_05205 [Verrucomicrobia bacterium]|nr:hypothetical protein [Verrucomicrobiota bacterium]